MGCLFDMIRFPFLPLKQVSSAKLLGDIGFKTKVTLDDTLEVLRIWRESQAPFKARYYDTFVIRCNYVSYELKETIIFNVFNVPIISLSFSFLDI